MELPKRLGLGFVLSRTRAQKGRGNPGECLLVAGRLGLIEVAIEAVLGDAKELAGALARLGNEEGTATVEVANGTNALVFGHECRGLAHKLLALVQQVFEQVADVLGNRLGLGIARAAGAGKGVERTLKSLHKRNVKVDAQNADGFALIVADKDRRGLEQLAIGGFGEVWLAVVYVGGALVHGLKHDMAGAVTQFASADVAVFDHYDGVVHVLGLQIVDDDFAVGAKLERQAVCKALIKLNLCGGHRCLPKN